MWIKYFQLFEQNEKCTKIPNALHAKILSDSAHCKTIEILHCCYPSTSMQMVLPLLSHLMGLMQSVL